MTGNGSQSEIVAWLMNPATHDAAGGNVERITTHAAIVFLIGDCALKMKRDVKFAYLDFTTLASRSDALTRELRLNRRTAPELYLGVRPIYRTHDGKLSFRSSPNAQIVEWLLEMKRFDSKSVLDQIADRGDLNAELIDKLAANIAKFHAIAERRPIEAGADHFAKVLRSNDSELRNCGEIDLTQVDQISKTSLQFVQDWRRVLDRRARQGFVRHCHGDLHLANIVVLDGEPTPFDCLEFRDDFATTDVLYDIAFPLMDLICRRLRPLANRLLNTYLWQLPFTELQETLHGLPLMRLFVSCRAAVRAHVLGRRIHNETGSHASQALDSYIDLAKRAFEAPKPKLVAIGGLSGTGKTTLAKLLAPDIGAVYGAVHLRTDVIRKQKARTDLDARLPDSAYAKSQIGRIYDDLCDLASRAVQGETVILDGVFADPREREAVQQVATAAGVPFVGIWLVAETDEMERRLDARKSDASDATGDVLRKQLTYDLGKLDWHRIDANKPVDVSAVTARAVIGS